MREEEKFYLRTMIGLFITSTTSAFIAAYLCDFHSGKYESFEVIFGLKSLIGTVILAPVTTAYFESRSNR